MRIGNPTLMPTISQDDLELRYPTPLIRGKRISRIGENHLGSSRTDIETCQALGENQVGWFVGGVSTFDRMIDHVRQINESALGSRWIVIPATRVLAEVAYGLWSNESLMDCSSSKATMWHDELVTFCVPERLAELTTVLEQQGTPIAGTILLDPNCIVHLGRAFHKGRDRIAHDRPQLIVDFRASQALGDWSPPLIVMSRHRAAAVNTLKVARVFCLESFQFIEGRSLRSGPLPMNSPKGEYTARLSNAATMCIS